MVGWLSALPHYIISKCPQCTHSEHLWTRSSDASTLTHWHWEWASSGRSWKILEPQPQGPAGPCEASVPCICCSASSHSQSIRYPPDLQSPHHLEGANGARKLDHLGLSMYPPVNVYITMENHHAINGKIHYKWPFSIAMLVYQRVYQCISYIKIFRGS